MSKPYRVLVVDDSPFTCRLLTRHLESVPDIEVVATVLRAEPVIPLIQLLCPDVVTLDLDMPGTNGLVLLDEIMHVCPVPVLLVSGVSRQAALAALAALEAGAVDFVLKYTPGADTDPERLRQEIVSKARAVARVKVIRSLGARRPAFQPQAARPAAPSVASATMRHPAPTALVVIGSSTGGPQTVRQLLAVLPPRFPAAIVVVQHLPPTFTRAFAEQLAQQLPLRVKEAETGDPLRAGVVLVAPGDWHLLITEQRRVELRRGPKIGGHRPAIDVTMQSAAQVFKHQTAGIVLTGMGNDGTLGLEAIRLQGGRTLAQEPSTCVIDGMPQRALERGVVDQVADPEALGRLLLLFHPQLCEV